MLALTTLVGFPSIAPNNIIRENNHKKVLMVKEENYIIVWNLTQIKATFLLKYSTTGQLQQ